jgi:hypothetical protein
LPGTGNGVDDDDEAGSGNCSMEMFFVFLWKPLNAALIAVWLFVPWGQITYNVISYVDPK